MGRFQEFGDRRCVTCKQVATIRRRRRAKLGLASLTGAELEQLPPLERQVADLMREGKDRGQVGRIVGVTTERVREIERSALWRIPIDARERRQREEDEERFQRELERAEHVRRHLQVWPPS